MSAKLGEILVRENLLTPHQLREALEFQREHGGRLGFNLVKMGLVSDDMITAVLSRQYGVPSVNLELFDIDDSVIRLIPREVAEKYSVLPLSRVGATLTLAMVDPTNVFAMDDIKFMTGLNIEPVVVSEASVQEAISRYYSQSRELELARDFEESQNSHGVADSLPDRLGPGALTGHTVLVQGGAGAVGNAAIQLARWADATVIATVSSPRKAQLAAAAGASHVVDYREQDVVAEVRKVAPKGVDAIVEVSAATNAAVDAQVIGLHGAVAMYADDGGAEVTVPVRAQMVPNARWQFVLVYTEPGRAKAIAVEDVNAAVLDGAVRVGEDAGLPLHVFPLAETAQAHRAVEDGAVGKVLVDVTA